MGALQGHEETRQAEEKPHRGRGAMKAAINAFRQSHTHVRVSMSDYPHDIIILRQVPAQLQHNFLLARAVWRGGNADAERLHSRCNSACVRTAMVLKKNT